MSHLSYFLERYCPRGLTRVAAGKGSWLMPVSKVEAWVSRHPRRKLTIALARFEGGQTNAHVEDVFGIGIDLDGVATREDVTALCQRFPMADVVWSNGITLFLRLSPNELWKEGVQNWSVQIGLEAERLTGLKYDLGCQLAPSTMQPAAHRNHLFRLPAGWATKRNAPVEFFPAVIDGYGVDAGVGLTHPWPSPVSKAIVLKPARKPVSRSAGSRASKGDSFGQQREECKSLLHLRSAGFTAAEAAVRCGVSESRVHALWGRPGYEQHYFRKRPLQESPSRSYRWNDGGEDVGVIGLQSSSRRIQRSYNVPANFGHSTQAMWDAHINVDTAWAHVLSLDEFAFARLWFQSRFGECWMLAMREDLEALYRKFSSDGGNKGRCVYSQRCKERVLAALGEGPASAPTLAQRAGYSTPQVKRVLWDLKREGIVAATGKNRGCRWCLVTPRESDHTTGIAVRREGEKRPLYLVNPSSIRTGFGILNDWDGRERWKWSLRGNCRIRNGGKQAYRRLVKTLRVEIIGRTKDRTSANEVIALGLCHEAEKFWVARPKAFRRLKARFAWRERQRKNSHPLQQEWCGPQANFDEKPTIFQRWEMADLARADRFRQFCEQIWKWETRDGYCSLGSVAYPLSSTLFDTLISVETGNPF